MKQSMTEAGYAYERPLGHGEHLLRDVETGKLEVWFANKNHASYGIAWRNTHLEFARGFTSARAS